MVTFGGSQDDDDDDELNSEAQDDMNFYDTKTQRWFTAVVKGTFSLRVLQPVAFQGKWDSAIKYNL